MPPTLTSVDTSPTMLDIATGKTCVDEFMCSITSLDYTEFENVSSQTVSQHMSPEWHKQRQGRITASNVHDTFTKMNTINKSEPNSVSTKSLCDRLMGDSGPPHNLAATKYGRRMEERAAKTYLKINSHNNLKSTKPGLTVMKGIPYLAASNDLSVECDCCGKGVVEIKCPFSASHTTPSSETVSYLVRGEDGQDHLKKNTQYYDQMQMQMAVSGCDWGDFFVYSVHGNLTDRVPFDLARWKVLQENCDAFFKDILAPQILKRANGNIEEPAIVEPLTVLQGIENIAMSANNVTCTATSSSSEIIAPKKKTKRPRRNKTTRKLAPVYLCRLCDQICLEPEDLASDSENSIECTTCQAWCHWGCLDIKGSGDPRVCDEYWVCPMCDAF